jgi:hypothetical protein
LILDLELEFPIVEPNLVLEGIDLKGCVWPFRLDWEGVFLMFRAFLFSLLVLSDDYGLFFCYI